MSSIRHPIPGPGSRWHAASPQPTLGEAVYGHQGFKDSGPLDKSPGGDSDGPLGVVRPYAYSSTQLQSWFKPHPPASLVSTIPIASHEQASPNEAVQKHGIGAQASGVPKTTPFWARERIWVVLLILVVAIILGVSLGTTFSKSSNSANGSNPVSETATLSTSDKGDPSTPLPTEFPGTDGGPLRPPEDDLNPSEDV